MTEDAATSAYLCEDSQCQNGKFSFDVFMVKLGDVFVIKHLFHEGQSASTLDFVRAEWTGETELVSD